MIDRYSRKEIKSIWEDKNKYSIWLNIELAAAEAMERLGVIPKGISKKVRSKAKINVKRILKIEDKVKHDVIAFLTSITELAGKDARHLHKGMTSSDVLDTCFNLQLKQSGEILLKDINQLLLSIKHQALKHKYTICDEYVADELCGYPNTTQLWQDLANGFQNLWSKTTFSTFDEKIPFHLISGDQDKVNNDGTQAENIHNLLIESGLKSELKIFKGMRHEPFQEKKRQKVFESILDFYLSNI